MLSPVQCPVLSRLIRRADEWIKLFDNWECLTCILLYPRNEYKRENSLVEFKNSIAKNELETLEVLYIVQTWKKTLYLVSK